MSKDTALLLLGMLFFGSFTFLWVCVIVGFATLLGFKF